MNIFKVKYLSRFKRHPRNKSGVQVGKPHLLPHVIKHDMKPQVEGEFKTAEERSNSSYFSDQ